MSRNVSRRAFVFSSSAALTACAASPSSTRRISRVNSLVGFKPGASIDRTCRAAQIALTSAGLAQTASVEVLEGGGGKLAYDRLLNRNIDNTHTVMMSGSGLILRGLNGQFPYRFTDFALACQFSTEVFAFAVKGDSRFHTLADVLRAIKEDVKSVRFCGDSTVGLMEHMGVTKMLMRAGIRPAGVPYVPKLGDGNNINAVLKGETEVVIVSATDIVEQQRDGSLRVLAVSSDSRIDAFPEVPTLLEAGVPDAVFYNARGFLMAPWTDPAQVEAMGAMLEKLVATPEWEKQRTKSDVTMLFARPPAAQAFFARQEQEVKVMLRALGIVKASF